VELQAVDGYVDLGIWIGSNTVNAAGVYGTKGQAGTGNTRYFNDLWEYVR